MVPHTLCHSTWRKSPSSLGLGTRGANRWQASTDYGKLTNIERATPNERKVDGEPSLLLMKESSWQWIVNIWARKKRRKLGRISKVGLGVWLVGDKRRRWRLKSYSLEFAHELAFIFTNHYIMFWQLQKAFYSWRLKSRPPPHLGNCCCLAISNSLWPTCCMHWPRV